jgi:hypothetical protein
VSYNEKHKKLRPQGLGARKPRDIDSLGYYKVEE